MKETESGNIAPKTKFDYFKAAARPLLKYVCVPMVPVVLLMEHVSLDKTKVFFAMVILLFAIRGGEKVVDMWTGRH